MIKNWKEFLLLESKYDLTKVGNSLELTEYKDDRPSIFGIDENEIEDNFYLLNDYKLYLSHLELTFVDDDGFVREDIKIGESLKPCIYIELNTKSDSKGNEQTINDIKYIIKKIKTITKFKSSILLKDFVIFDPNIRASGRPNINSEKIKLEDPFSIISISESGDKFKYNLNNEEVKSLDLDFCLISDNKIEITDEIFYKHYKLSGAEAIDKDGELWCEFNFNEIAEILFKDSNYVEKYFYPEEWDFDAFNVESKYIIDDVVSSISDENKKNYLTLLLDLEFTTLENLNDICEESYDDLNDLIENITDEDLKTIIEENDDDMTQSFIWYYNDGLNTKYQKVAEDYIRDETLKYIDKYIECDYVNYIDKENYKEYIWIKYDPIIFEYEYKNDDEPDDWANWGNRLQGEDINNSIFEEIYEHSKQISWSDYIGDGIYMSSYDINNYISDIIKDYS